MYLSEFVFQQEMICNQAKGLILFIFIIFVVLLAGTFCTGFKLFFQRTVNYLADWCSSSELPVKLSFKGERKSIIKKSHAKPISQVPHVCVTHASSIRSALHLLLHDGEAKGTAAGLSVTDFTDTFLFWEVSWEDFQTGGKGLLTNDGKNRASHPQHLFLFCFHQIFLMWALKEEEVAKGHLARNF